MIKSVLVLSLLCAPAMADSNTSYVIDFTSKTSKHTLIVADRACGEVQVKSPQAESYFKVCAHSNDDGKHVRLEIDRRVRENQTESRQSAVVVAVEL